MWRERHRLEGGNSEWLRLLSEKSESKDPVIAKRFGLLAALMQRQYYPQTTAVLKALSQGGEMLPEHRQLARWYYLELSDRERKTAARAEVLIARSGRRLGWSDLRQEQYHMHLTPLIAEAHAVELVGTVIRGAVLLGGPSIDKGMDLTFLHGEHTVDGVRLNVAGHKSPVRISAAEAVDGDSFVGAARRLILERL